MSQLNSKPYILRALYEWCLDSGHTPHIIVWVNEHTQVPMSYVHENEIVLNIGPAASHNLSIDNDWVHFSARFNGKAEDIWIPVGHVSSLFARETGEGMSFEVEPWAPAEAENSISSADESKPVQSVTDEPQSVRKGLKIVK